MNNFLKIIVVILFIVSCTKKNCVTTSDLAFADLKEGENEHYEYIHDSLSLNMPKYITPNNDGVNDEFEISTNIVDYVAADFRLTNACEEVLHKEHLVFPFTFPDPKTMEDGQYEFTFSIVLEDKKTITGSNLIRIIRK
jgi:hypothetical protein